MAEEEGFTPFPTVTPGGPPQGDYLNIPVSGRAFGAQVGEGMQKGGEAIARGGEAMFRSGISWMEMNDSITANDVSAKAMDKINSLYGEYATLEGKNAFDQAGAYRKKILDTANAAISSVGGKTQEQVANDLRHFQASVMGEITRYGATQGRKAQRETAADLADAKGNAAMSLLQTGNRDGAEKLLNEGADIYAGEAAKEGLDNVSQDAMRQKYKGAYYKMFILDLAKSGDIETANAMLDAHRGDMDAKSQYETDAGLAPYRNELTTKNNVDNAVTPVPPDAPGLPHAPHADPYARIPAKGEHGEDQAGMFRKWNSDPVGNSDAVIAQVNPQMQRVVHRAQEILQKSGGPKFVAPVGLRTEAQQKMAEDFGWADRGSGADDKAGNAIDLWPVDDKGQVYFDRKDQMSIRKAMEQAAKELNVGMKPMITGTPGTARASKGYPVHYSLSNPDPSWHPDANAVPPATRPVERSSEGSPTVNSDGSSRPVTTQGAHDVTGRVRDSAGDAMATKYEDAIAGIESGGNYSIVGPHNAQMGSALGRYQVMEVHLHGPGSWAQQVFGRDISKEEFLKSPELQDKMFDTIFGGYVKQYGPEGAAAHWFGSGTDVLGTTTDSYVKQFMANLNGGKAVPHRVGGYQPTPADELMRPKADALRSLQLMDQGRPDQLRRDIAELDRRYSIFNAENAQEIADLKANVPLMIAKVESGEVDPEQVQFPSQKMYMYTPGMAPAWQQEWEAATKVNAITSGLKLANSSEFAKAIDEIGTGRGPYSDRIRQLAGGDEGIHFRLQQQALNGLKRALTEREKMVKGEDGDPVKYTIQNDPRVSQLSQQLHSSPTPANWHAFAYATIQRQIEMGLDPRLGEVHVLEKGFAEQITGEMKKNIPQAAKIIDSLRKQSGDAWDYVYRDLVTKGKLNHLFQGLVVLPPGPDRDIYADALAKQLDPEDKFKGWEIELGNGDDTVGKPIVKSVGEEAEQQFAPYRHSMRMSGNVPADQDGIRETIKVLAYGYLRDAGGSMTPKEAADKASTAFLGMWDYLEKAQGAARVPRELKTAIQDNTNKLWDWVKYGNFKPNDDLVAPRGANGLPPAGKISPEDYVTRLKSGGEWYTTPDNASIRLRAPAELGGGTVLGKDGQPVEIFFNQGKGPPTLSSNIEQPKQTAAEREAIYAEVRRQQEAMRKLFNVVIEPPVKRPGIDIPVHVDTSKLFEPTEQKGPSVDLTIVHTPPKKIETDDWSRFWKSITSGEKPREISQEDWDKANELAAQGKTPEEIRKIMVGPSGK